MPPTRRGNEGVHSKEKAVKSLMQQCHLARHSEKTKSSGIGYCLRRKVFFKIAILIAFVAPKKPQKILETI